MQSSVISVADGHSYDDIFIEMFISSMENIHFISMQAPLLSLSVGHSTFLNLTNALGQRFKKKERYFILSFFERYFILSFYEVSHRKEEGETETQIQYTNKRKNS